MNVWLEGDKVVFSKSPNKEHQTVVYEIIYWDLTSVTVKLVDEPVDCNCTEPDAHIYTMSIAKAEDLGMQLAPQQNEGS